jgi:ABC-2 type transport system ATP-binding protein
VPAPALSLRGLTKDYGTLRAVDTLDLDVPEGSVFGFLGPNGAGKTTTIRMVLGLVRPTAGSVEILGERIDRPGHPVLAHLGALVEQPAFYGHLSGRANLDLWGRCGPEPDRPRRERIDGVLHTVGLTEAAGRKVKTYSHGMRQRLGMAQALLNEPRLVVLDEPTDGLDPQGIRETRDLLRSLVADARTVFLSSHLLHEVEQVCDHVAVINDGRLVAAGPVADLRGAESLRLHTPDIDRATAVVAALGGESAVIGGTLSIRLPNTPPEDLVRRLVEDGVRVRALVPERAGLEEVYFQLVGP